MSLYIIDEFCNNKYDLNICYSFCYIVTQTHLHFTRSEMWNTENRSAVTTLQLQGDDDRFLPELDPELVRWVATAIDMLSTASIGWSFLVVPHTAAARFSLGPRSRSSCERTDVANAKMIDLDRSVVLL